MSGLLRTVAVVTLLVGSSCAPELETYLVESGAYETRGPDGSKTMRVERDREVVTITCVSDGHEVVETWRIASSKVWVTE